MQLETDVLVIGGGLAGTWAAVAAARAGAAVILADKGYCGTSGVTATAGPGHWWVPPDPAARAAAVEQRYAQSCGLGDRRWMERIIDLTWRTLPTLAGYYDFPVDEHGTTRYRGLRGPEYMRAMRSLVDRSGARILDQSPALELLLRQDGSVAGARGYRRQAGETWSVRAGAVVMATGGCAFLSRLLGCHTNTGDGHLMSGEAGAEFSGMEFSCYYTVSPAHSTMTRSMSYAFARYFDTDGRELDIPAGRDATRALASAMLAGPVFCRLDRIPADIRERLPRVQPNFMLPFVRAGIDPFTQRFEVTLRGEGTIRGTGGLRIVDDDCQTTVPGLFAAGDTATREPVAGATSGGGAQNSAWALTSGQWAGQAAARLALAQPLRRGEPAYAAGGAGLRPAGRERPVDRHAIIAAVQREMLAYDRNIFRSGAGLRRSRDTLEAAWREVSDSLFGENVEAIKARETAALVATARWCCAAALAREESRGMHQRTDRPTEDARFERRLLAGGTAAVWTMLETASPQAEVA